MDFDSTRPIYMQIIDLHKEALLTGEIKPGDKLLSQRDFAERYQVNPNTVQRAYREMEALGLVETFRGRGTFVAVTREMVEKMKEDKAQDALEAFTKELRTLGFSLSQVLTWVEERWLKEEGEL